MILIFSALDHTQTDSSSARMKKRKRESRKKGHTQCDGKSLRFSPLSKEKKIILCRDTGNEGRCVLREVLFSSWQAKFVRDSSLSRHVAKLRKNLSLFVVFSSVWRLNFFFFQEKNPQNRRKKRRFPFLLGCSWHSIPAHVECRETFSLTRKENIISWQEITFEREELVCLHEENSANNKHN